MKLVELKKKYIESLSSLYPPEELDSLFFIAAENCLTIRGLDLRLHLSKNTSPEAEKKMLKILDRLVIAEPIQYILGFSHFYNLLFKVQPGILIPRQETEYLVDIVIKEFKGIENLRILDLGTGSGCIAITLAKNLPKSNVMATDFSKAVLGISKENARQNHVCINFILDNILKPSATYDQFNIIVSNPPYVRISEKGMMHSNVLTYEPHSALFVDDQDPLIYYKAIATFAIEHLHPDGKIFLEINEHMGSEMKVLYIEKGFKNVEIVKDLNNKDRYLIWHHLNSISPKLILNEKTFA